MATIKVNGQVAKVLNAYSCGPGLSPHTYDVPGGYVYEIAGVWRKQTAGQFPYVVQVEV